MNEKERQICEDLWKECEPICRSICKSKFQSHPSEINDVISELFLALCQKMDSGEYPNEPKKWIYGTLNNLVKPHMTKVTCFQQASCDASSL